MTPGGKSKLSYLKVLRYNVKCYDDDYDDNKKTIMMAAIAIYKDHEGVHGEIMMTTF